MYAAQRGGACAVRNNKLDRIKQSSGTGTPWSRFRADILNGTREAYVQPCFQCPYFSFDFFGNFGSSKTITTTRGQSPRSRVQGNAQTLAQIKSLDAIKKSPCSKVQTGKMGLIYVETILVRGLDDLY